MKNIHTPYTSGSFSFDPSAAPLLFGNANLAPDHFVGIGDCYNGFLNGGLLLALATHADTFGTDSRISSGTTWMQTS